MGWDYQGAFVRVGVNDSDTWDGMTRTSHWEL